MSTIIVVEDNEALARGIVYALQKEGWKAELATSVKEFDHIYKENLDASLILLDVMLPDGNGFDICEKVRKQSDVPIVFLTASNEEISIVMGLDMGADDYITKPFRTKELISRIKAILRRTRNSIDSNILLSNDIILNLSTAKTYRNNCEIILSPTEFRLLAIFMQNPLNILDRTTILSKLWDIDGQFVDDNTLSVYVSRLREKIEKDVANPEYILTIRGLGYMWNQRSTRG